ncbi:MAG: Virus attachment protein p12 family protein [Syntrophorhabdaceae bacterium PtaU1.Bin034]|nr:MAG: Virus attachment protein p12 family protein [Syntrophorhabdaceae bacterium PtaU1.Bin034]
MLETIGVIIIVMVVLVLAGRSFYRTWTGKKQCCGCGGCASSRKEQDS